jgi:hypothetical protein
MVEKSRGLFCAPRTRPTLHVALQVGAETVVLTALGGGRVWKQT